MIAIPADAIGIDHLMSICIDSQISGNTQTHRQTDRQTDTHQTTTYSPMAHVSRVNNTLSLAVCFNNVFFSIKMEKIHCSREVLNSATDTILTHSTVNPENITSQKP